MASSLDTARPDAPASWRVVLGAALVLVVIAAFGYLVGRHQGEQAGRTHVLTGRGYVGINQMSVKVDGWAYGAEPKSVVWFDAKGGEHDGSTAPCLRGWGHYATITFGWVPASFPNGSGERDVIWIRCRR